MTTLFKFLSTLPWQLFFFLPNQEHGTFFFHFASANNPRRHILSFNLALFILFCTFFFAPFDVEREMDKNHARHYPTPKLLRFVLCFMGNAITFILFVVKIYFFFCLFLSSTNVKVSPWRKL